MAQTFQTFPKVFKTDKNANGLIPDFCAVIKVFWISLECLMMFINTLMFNQSFNPHDIRQLYELIYLLQIDLREHDFKLIINITYLYAHVHTHTHTYT